MSERAIVLVEGLDGSDTSAAEMLLDQLSPTASGMADEIGDRLVEMAEMADVLKREAAVANAKRQRIEKVMDLLKSHMLTVLRRHDADEAMGRRWTATMCKSPDKVVLDVDMKDLPHELTRVKREPDKMLIKAALKEHFEEIDKYAHLESSEYVRLNGRRA